MRTSLLPLALASLLLAAGCGGHQTHKALADYLNSVQSVQAGMVGPLQEVTNANKTFAKSQQEPQLKRELVTSEHTMRRLRAKLAAIDTPPEAKHLRVLLLRLVDNEIELADEVSRLATFVPRYRIALGPLQPASAALRAKLTASAKGAAATKELNAAKADELTAYAETLRSVMAKVRALDPPLVWQPTYTQQLASLEQLRTTALALARAVRTNDATAIPSLLQRFDAAAISNQTVAAQKREIAAVRAYNARIDRLLKLTGSIQKERTRLEQRYR